MIDYIIKGAHSAIYGKSSDSPTCSMMCPCGLQEARSLNFPSLFCVLPCSAEEQASLNFFSKWCPFMSCSWLRKTVKFNLSQYFLFLVPLLFVCIPFTFALKCNQTHTLESETENACLFMLQSGWVVTGKSFLQRGWTQGSVCLVATVPREYGTLTFHSHTQKFHF